MDIRTAAKTYNKNSQCTVINGINRHRTMYFCTYFSLLIHSTNRD